MSDDSIEYELSTSFQYSHHEQGLVEAKFITMNSPSVAHLNTIAILSQDFTRALLQSRKYQQNAMVDKEENEDTEDSNKESELSKRDVLIILEGSEIDMAKFCNNFKKLMRSKKLFLVEGETEFKENLIDKLSTLDFYGMMGTYISNFICASLQMES